MPALHSVGDVYSGLFCVICSCPLICTLLDGLASPCVPVSAILDFVLAYQVTLIEIRKYTERNEGTKDIQKPFCCGEIILNMMGFGLGLCLQCWQRWKHWIQTTWTLSSSRRDCHVPRLNLTEWLLKTYSSTVWFELVIKTFCCVILVSFTVRPDVLFCCT